MLMKSTVRSQTPSGLVTPGATQIERDAGGFFPEGELAPVLLLAEVPAVIAPEHDDRVVLVRALVERVEQPADHRVAKVMAAR